VDVKEAIERRRALRSLVPVPITLDMIEDLASCASLAPSCFNKQPWRFVFITGEENLSRAHEALSPGNEWARKGSMIAAVHAGIDDDCRLAGRDYYLFDSGLATAVMILRATELGLVAHPIAGYDEEKMKTLFDIPSTSKVIALVIFGKHAGSVDPLLSEKQAEAETERPPRLDLPEFVRIID
jgi:nitroreductase